MRLLCFLLLLPILSSCTDYAVVDEKEVQTEKLALQFYEKSRDIKSPLIDRKKNIQKALTLTTQNDSLKASLLYTKSSIHFSLHEYDSVFYVGRRLRALATDSTAYLSLGKYDHLLAYYHENIAFNMDSAFFYNNTSKNYFLKIPDSSRALKRVLRQAILKNISNDFFGAKETLTEALEYLKTNENNKDLAIVYGELASNNNRLLNYPDAISYYKLAIQTSDNQKDILGYKNNLATILTKQEDYASAILLLKAVLRDTLLKEGTATYARVLDNLAYAQWKIGDTDPIEPFLKALKIRKLENDKRGQIASYSNLGEYYSKKKPNEATMYFDSVIHLSKQLKIPKAEQDALKFLMNFEPNNVTIRDRYVVLQDSLYQVGLGAKTQFAKMKYDDEQKQLAILQLEADQERKNAELSEERTQRIIWSSFSTLLLIGGISVFYNLRQSHKKERLQEVYETEKRISKVVHDELANDMYGLMNRLERMDSFPKSAVLDSLERMYNQTRDISRSNASIPVEAYGEELKKLLSQFRDEKTVITAKGLKSIAWEKLAEEKKISLYRILNELLVNMKKHSGATAASFSFNKTKKHLHVGYADNGKGIQLPIKKGVGLSNTETRINKIKGRINFDSEPGKGIRITISFPV